MCCCEKCVKKGGLVILALGILFLLRDINLLGEWNFWGIQWWTALFLLAGISFVMHGSCPECKIAKPGKKK